MIELKTYAGSNVTPQNDAIMNDTNTLNNGIYYGCNVTIKDATTLHINAGQGIVYGRLFEVLDSDIPVSLSPSGTLLGQLYVHIDLSNIAAPIQILVDTGETLADLEDDPQLNIDSGITDMQLATFTVSTVGMSDLVETFKAVEPIRAVLGDADISTIGDGSVKGAIRTINTHLQKLSWNELWTNPNPTANFTPQTITLASSDYDFLLIEAYLNATYTNMGVVTTILPSGIVGNIMCLLPNPNGVECGVRRVTPNGASLAFEDASYYVPGGGARAQNNRLVPVKIYGMKNA